MLSGLRKLRKLLRTSLWRCKNISVKISSDNLKNGDETSLSSETSACSKACTPNDSSATDDSQPDSDVEDAADNVVAELGP